MCVQPDLILLVEIHTIAHSFPALAIESLTELLVTRECQPWNEESKATILNQLPNPHFRRAVAHLLDTWQREATDLDSRTLAAALTTAAYSIAAMGDTLSGSLHAKCAIADKKHLFISSANLTEYALTLNMEMGLLVKSEDLARQVKEHIDSLIERGILVLASPIN